MAKNNSFIRWAGGKSWFVPAVQNMIQNLQYNNYIEPFMGGASVFFALDPPNEAYLSDINSDLVNTFIQIRDNLDGVKTALRLLNTDEQSYYLIRDNDNGTPIEMAARFLYLNFYSFNGIYRVNRVGKYNVPYGNRAGEFNYDRLDRVSEKLQNAHIQNQDFMACQNSIHANDLVFLDPPYAVSAKSSDNNHFIAYNPKLFSLQDQNRLGNLVDLIQNRGAFYILTNAYHPQIKEIFDTKGVTLEFDRTCNIGGKSAKRGKVKEYIFTNIPNAGRREAED